MTNRNRRRRNAAAFDQGELLACIVLASPIVGIALGVLAFVLFH